MLVERAAVGHHRRFLGDVGLHDGDHLGNGAARDVIAAHLPPRSTSESMTFLCAELVSFGLDGPAALGMRRRAAVDGFVDLDDPAIAAHRRPRPPARMASRMRCAMNHAVLYWTSNMRWSWWR